MQHLVEVFGGDALHGFGVRQADVLVLRHVDRDAQRGHAGALADAGLEHPELALLDGELGVTHVAVVVLEPAEDGEQFLVQLREVVREGVEIFGVANARHHVFALRVHQEVAVGLALAGGRVAREPDPGSRVVVAVAEHHRLHVDGGAEIVADALAVAIGDGARAVPALEHRLDRAAELLVGVLRERLAGELLHRVLVGLAQRAQDVGG